jgi:hypothetical protein
VKRLLEDCSCEVTLNLNLVALTQEAWVRQLITLSAEPLKLLTTAAASSQTFIFILSKLTQ